MQKNFKIGSLAILSGALLISAMPSQAQTPSGQWEVGFEFEGYNASSTTTSGSIHPPSTSVNFSNGIPMTRSGASDSAASLNIPEFRYNFNLSVTPVLRWVPTQPNGIAPDELRILLSADASGGAMGSQGSNPVSMSMGGLTVVSDNNSFSPYGPGFGIHSKTLAGKRLVVVGNASRATEVRLPAYSVTSAGVSIAGQAHFHTAKDTRAVTLSRGGRHEYTTYENGVPVTYGDTTYSYLSEMGANIESHPNVPEFTATFAGGWTDGVSDPNVTWNWIIADGLTVPNVSPWRWKTGSKWQADFGQLRKVLTFDAQTLIRSDWRGTPNAPKTTTLKYFARDNGDNAEAEGRYVLTLHDPVERILYKASLIHAEQDYFNSNNQPFIVTGPDPGGEIINRTYSDSTGWQISGSINGIEDYLEPLGGEVGYQWSHTDGEERSSSPCPPVTADRYYFARVWHDYKRHHSHFWKYDQAGKEKRMVAVMVGNNTVMAEAPHEAIWDTYLQDEIKWEWRLHTNPIGPPSYNPNLPTPTTPPPSYDYS